MELTKKLLPAWIDLEHKGETIGFLCNPLTAAQRLSVLLRMEDPNRGELALYAVECTVVDWRGITLAGSPVPYSPEALRQLFADRELVELLSNLFRRVTARGELSETEKKT